MVARAILLALFFPGAVVASNPSSPTNPERPPQVIQDPSTKVLFYLESDRRHVAAIGLDGRLLWCKQIIAPSKDALQNSFFIDSIGFKDKDSLYLLMWVGGGTSATIDKKTGAVKWSGIVQ